MLSRIVCRGPVVMRPYWRVLLVVVWAAAGVALLAGRSRPAPTGIGEAEKVGSGRSFAGQVDAAARPSASAVASGFAASRLWSGEDDWEPANAADPSSPYVYQLTTRYSGEAACRRCALPAIIFRRSADGGNTWEPDRFLSPSRRSQNDPMIEVATDGTIYVAWLERYRPGVSFSKSSDHGDTWSKPVRFTEMFLKPRWNDRPVLAISGDGRHVYVAYNASDSYIVASHDFGETWQRRVMTNRGQRYWFHSSGALAPDGTAYFGVFDFSQDYRGPAHAGVLRSTDGGLTWQYSRLDQSARMPDCEWAAGCYFGFLGGSIGLAVDDSGAVVVAYHTGDEPRAPQPMYTRRSADGLIWEPRQQLSAETLEHNAFPAVAAGPGSGDFRVAWQGSLDGRPDTWNTWLRQTADGGRTWAEPLRLSDTTTPAPYRSTDGYRFPYGDYMELSVDGDGVNHVIWGEGLSYYGPGGTWYSAGQY